MKNYIAIAPACFAAIGGLEAGLGWDTIDEVRAMMLGFGTRNFRHIHAYHHRPQGAAGGLSRGRKAAGRAAYNVGYLPVFLMARALRAGLNWPPLIGGMGLVAVTSRVPCSDLRCRSRLRGSDSCVVNNYAGFS